MIWIALFLMLALAVWLLRTPLHAANARVSPGRAERIYREQLAELEREVLGGHVAAEDAKLARLEIQRRLLSCASDPGGESEKNAAAVRRFLFPGLAILLSASASLIYVVLGSPQLTQAPNAADAMAQSSPARIAAMAEDQLKQRPDNARLWTILGWARFRGGDADGAVAAYARAAALAPQHAPTLSAYGEALIGQANGRVTDAAAEMLSRAVLHDPADTRARFLLGLRKEQQGDARGALEDWLALLAEAGPGEQSWAAPVRSRVLELAQRSGVDVSARLSATPAPPGPDAADLAAAANMTPAAREAIIRAMVEGLDARLTEQSRDVAEWRRLIHARLVLGERAEARAAKARARVALHDDPAALAQLETPDLRVD